MWHKLNHTFDEETSRPIEELRDQTVSPDDPHGVLRFVEPGDEGPVVPPVSGALILVRRNCVETVRFRPAGTVSLAVTPFRH